LPAARAARFPEPTFHDLRHAGASLMVAADCHVEVIAEQMGCSGDGASGLRGPPRCGNQVGLDRADAENEKRPRPGPS